MKYGITDSMAIPKYAEIKDRIRIDMDTGRAIIPDLEWTDHPNLRIPDMDNIKDYFAVETLYRRLMVVDAMNTIIRNANDENISYGDWLAVGVADGDNGLDLYDYINDETFKDISQTFVDIISDVKDIDDLVY